MALRAWIALAGLGSAGLLLGAFAFQHVGGLAPCPMCIWQRWPHGAAIVIALLALAAPRFARPLAALGALAAGTTAGIGVYHGGVEQKWWEGPSTCSGGPSGDLTTDELLTAIMEAPIVRCDEIPWEMLGLSMAGWNAVISAGLVVLWLTALMRGRTV